MLLSYSMPQKLQGHLPAAKRHCCSMQAVVLIVGGCKGGNWRCVHSTRAPPVTSPEGTRPTQSCTKTTRLHPETVRVGWQVLVSHLRSSTVQQQAGMLQR